VLIGVPKFAKRISVSPEPCNTFRASLMMFSKSPAMEHHRNRQNKLIQISSFILTAISCFRMSKVSPEYVLSLSSTCSMVAMAHPGLLFLIESRATHKVRFHQAILLAVPKQPLDILTRVLVQSLSLLHSKRVSLFFQKHLFGKINVFPFHSLEIKTTKRLNLLGLLTLSKSL